MKNMKWITFFVSFFAYAAVHIMRMSYSSVKTKIDSTYNLGPIFLGLFDGLVYISLGTGFFLTFFIESYHSKIKIYLIFSIITGIAYSIIPLLSLLLANEQEFIVTDSFLIRYIIPGFSLICFGFCQFPCWASLLYFVNQHFDVKKQGTSLGLWSANGDVGNIIGFMLSHAIIFWFEAEWQIVMLSAAGFHIIMGITVYNLCEDEKNRGIDGKIFNPEITNDLKGTKRFIKFLLFVREVIRDNNNKLYLLAMALLKSILYGFLLWMPTFMKHKNWADFADYVPTIFNICTVGGSALLGYFYKDIQRYTKEQYDKFSLCSKIWIKTKMNCQGYSLFYSCLLITACLIFFYFIIANLLFYILISAIIGFFLGGAFNMLAGNEVIAITNGQEEKVEMLSILSMSTGNWGVGIVEIIIGLALNVNNLFIVLMACSSLAALSLVIRGIKLARVRAKEEKLLSQNLITDSK